MKYGTIGRIWLAIIAGVLFVSLSSTPAFAEHSVKQILEGVDSNWSYLNEGDWFDTDGFKGDKSGTTYHNWDATMQTWAWDNGGSAMSSIVIEDAGYANYNAFGWYDAYDLTRRRTLLEGGDDSGSGAVTLKPGSGSDSNVVYMPPDVERFGFWLDGSGNFGGTGQGEGPWLTEHFRNADGQTHQRLYKESDIGDIDGEFDVVYGLFWEDLNRNSWCHDDSGWDWEDVHSEEPDYNDLVIQMGMSSASGHGPTPELPASGLLLVGMIPVGLAYLRRKARRDGK